MFKLTLLLVGTFLTIASAQIPSFGKCPNVKTQESLDLNKYLGDWYEILVFPTIFEHGKCTRARYTMKPNGHIEVFNRGIEDGKVSSIIGDVYRPDDKEQGKLKVRFGDKQPYGDYGVVHTDYDNYSLVYSCGNVVGLFHVEMAWVLSRNMTLDPTMLEQLKEELASYKVDISKFKVSDQSDCPP